MKQKPDWEPSKFEKRKEKWRSSRRAVDIGSRLIGDRLAEAYQECLSRYAGGALLDLGCGNAPLAGIYKDIVRDYTWVDWPNSPHQQYHVDLCADLNNLIPIYDLAFDTILLSDVLEHIRTPDQLLSECARLLSEDGHLIIGVPFMYPLHEEPHDYYRYTTHKLRDLAEKNSLEVIQIKECAGGLEVAQDVMVKILSYSRASRWLAYAVYYLFVAALSIPYIENMNRKLSKKFPLAYVMVCRKPGIGIQNTK